jgi:hypothetical protein
MNSYYEELITMWNMCKSQGGKEDQKSTQLQ